MEVREEVRQLARPLAEDDGFELVDVELASAGRHRVIRVSLDKPGGVSLGDCARFSRRLSDCLDMNQTVPGSYHLEVSSPGLERPLRTLEHVERFAGQRVTLATHEPRDGRRNWEGELLGARGRRGRACGRKRARSTGSSGPSVKSARLVVDPWEGLRNPKGRAAGDRRPRGGSR